MKTAITYLRFSISMITAVLTLATAVQGQSPEVHHISGLSPGEGGAISLSLSGTPPVPMQAYYDLFPVESSSDLSRWSPLSTVWRAKVTNDVTFTDTRGNGDPARFYRTPTNHFSTGFRLPSGVHGIGTLSRLLTDASRSNRFAVRTNQSFMATLWYPAESASPLDRAVYSDPLLAERKAFWGAYTNRIPSLYSLAVSNAPIAAAPALLPVIVYSHGLGDQQGRGVRTENTAMAQELASHGYLVISVDHTDTYGTVLPPNKLVLSGYAWSFDYLNDRLKDVGFVLDYLATLNAGDPLFKGRLDLDRIGLLGWSWGGATAAEACGREDRLKAAVLLDGALDSSMSVMKNGLLKPFLSMNSGALISENTALFNKAKTNAFLLTIKGASHEAFTDNSWLVAPSELSRTRAIAMQACLLSFFNRYLLGEDDQLLEKPDAQYPLVVSFRKK